MVDGKGKAYLFIAQIGRYIDYDATSDVASLRAGTGEALYIL
jgi:hypothetical protein